MFVGKRAIEAGAAVLRDVNACSEAEAEDLAMRVFKAMMEVYPSELHLKSYSRAPLEQQDVD